MPILCIEESLAWNDKYLTTISKYVIVYMHLRTSTLVYREVQQLVAFQVRDYIHIHVHSMHSTGAFDTLLSLFSWLASSSGSAQLFNAFQHPTLKNWKARWNLGRRLATLDNTYMYLCPRRWFDQWPTVHCSTASVGWFAASRETMGRKTTTCEQPVKL